MIQPITPTALAGIRINADNPNHHLWNNNGTWFIHYTVYPTPVTAERVRKSLHTRDLHEARILRDRELNRIQTLPEVTRET